MKKLIIPMIVFIGIGTNTFGQEKSNRELKGDKYAFSYSFDKAINSYTHAKQLTPAGQRSLAKSYHNMELNTQSDSVYSQLINSASSEILAEDYYNYAMVLKINGKNDEANKAMDKFAELKPDDLRARDYVVNKVELTNLSKDNGKYKIKHLNINTDAEDFGTCYYKNKIVFASSRAKPKMIVRKNNWNGKPYLDMYISEVENGEMKNPVIFEKGMNGKMHDGPVSFSKDGTFMAFTRNNYNDTTKDRIVEIQIYFSHFKDDKWSKPESFFLNNNNYSVGHPCLTADGNTMYFTSNMPGGYGGADIYRISKDEKGKWGQPVNLGDRVNTEGDEMFPFFEENNKTLFFASNGRFGLGGFDIFICEMKEFGFDRIYNAGYPLNTQYDDYAVIVNDQMNTGYFSSNRSGGSGDDDIYSFDIFKVSTNKTIQGIAMENNGNPLPKTFITLLDDKGTMLDTMTTKNDAAYAFSVASDKNFKLIGKKEHYLDGDRLVNTSGKELIIKADLTLLKKEELISQKIKVGADLGKILELKSIYYDLDKFNLRPDAVDELSKIVTIMNQYPDMIVELGAYADCRASKEYNQKLSDKRAKVSAWFIKARITKPERISGKGYGEENLTTDCACEGDVVSYCSDVQYQKDRRTEFIIIRKTVNPNLPLISTK